LDPVRGAVSSVLKRRIVKPTEQRRAEILAAALGLFGTKGFNDTTMEEVAGVAGVAKGTIYLYFESKEHLLLALKKDFMHGLTEAITGISAEAFEQLAQGKEVDYRDIIDDIFEVIIDYHCKHRDALEVVVRQNPGPDLVQEALDLERDFIQLLTNAFREGTTNGLVHAEDPEMTARLVNAAIRDNLAACLCYGEPNDLDRLVEGSKQLLYKALAPRIEMPPRRPRLVRRLKTP
jgi:AcrR family transcriptional regulator